MTITYYLLLYRLTSYLLCPRVTLLSLSHTPLVPNLPIIRPHKKPQDVAHASTLAGRQLQLQRQRPTTASDLTFAPLLTLATP